MKNNKTLLLLLIVGLTSCGLNPTQKKQITSFGTATESLATISQAQFKSYRDKVIEIQSRRVVIGESSLKSIESEGIFHDENKIQKLISGVEVLKAYGAALVSLSSNDQTDAIAKATNNLVNNFESYQKKQDKTLDADKKEAAKSAIKDIAGIYVDYNKKKALEKIINAYSGDIQNLAESLISQFRVKGYQCGITPQPSTKNDSSPSISDNYCIIAFSAKLDAEKHIASGCDAVSVAYAKETIFIANLEIKRVAILATENVIAVEKFIEANKKLTMVINSEDYEYKDISAFVLQIFDLNNTLKVLF